MRGPRGAKGHGQERPDLNYFTERLVENQDSKRGCGRLESRSRAVLKRIRSSQPINHLATSLVRGILGAARLRSELVVKHLHRVGHVKAALPNGQTLRLWSLGDDWISNQVYWRGWAGYEPEPD